MLWQHPGALHTILPPKSQDPINRRCWPFSSSCPWFLGFGICFSAGFDQSRLPTSLNIEQSGIALRSDRPLGGLRFRDMQVPTNLAGEIVINYGVSGDSRSFLIGSIYKNGVTTAFAQKLASVLFQMSNEIAPFHALEIEIDSRMTSCPLRDSSASARFASRIR